MRQVVYSLELYRDARSPEYKKIPTSFATTFSPSEIRSSNAPEYTSVSIFRATSRLTKQHVYSENKRMCLMSRFCTLKPMLLPLSSYTFSTLHPAAHKTLMVSMFTCLHPRYLFFILILRGSCFPFPVHESPTERRPPLIPVTLA